MTRGGRLHWIDPCDSIPGPAAHFAIEVTGRVAGGAGIKPRHDVQRHVGEIGYWLGEPHWGRGVATEAVRMLVPYAFMAFGFRRLEALVFGWNPASGRVLEKAGFELEARLPDAVLEDGALTDLLIYGMRRPACEG